MAKIFRGSLFGYNKKDVQRYVEEISTSFNSQLEEYKGQIEALENQRADLDKKRAEIESKKSAISEAIISAQEKGERIIAEAREKAEKERENMQKMIAEENGKLVKIRREIVNIRRSAIKTLNNLSIDTDETSAED